MIRFEVGVEHRGGQEIWTTSQGVSIDLRPATTVDRDSQVDGLANNIQRSVPGLGIRKGFEWAIRPHEAGALLSGSVGLHREGTALGSGLDTFPGAM